VRFVGSPTIGEDHVDKSYLEAQGIGFASAPGSNANSVAEYVVGALLQLAGWREADISNKRLGIVGHGNVGKRVEAKAHALGMECVLNDPPLAREGAPADYRDIAEIQRCDIVTFHVPLTKEGPDKTLHLVDEAFLERCKTGMIVLNTSRGSVIDGTALRTALESGAVGAAVLDVWENEPNIDPELLANCAIGTPHIAGYSYDGKVAGTRMVYEAVCAYFDIEPTWNAAAHLAADGGEPIDVTGIEDPDEAVRTAVRTVYDIRDDDKPLRKFLTLPEVERGPHFDALRRDYPRRREFPTAVVKVGPEQAETRRILEGLGFQVLER
jgi:erythronate-4-phosphate dehydrogenase